MTVLLSATKRSEEFLLLKRLMPVESHETNILNNTNSFHENGSDFYAIFYVSNESFGELRTNLRVLRHIGSQFICFG